MGSLETAVWISRTYLLSRRRPSLQIKTTFFIHSIHFLYERQGCHRGKGWASELLKVDAVCLVAVRDTAMMHTRSFFCSFFWLQARHGSAWASPCSNPGVLEELCWKPGGRWVRWAPRWRRHCHAARAARALFGTPVPSAGEPPILRPFPFPLPNPKLATERARGTLALAIIRSEH